MRMRTKPWAKGYLEQEHSILIEHPEENRGKWRELLPFDTLNVEIGTGKGDYWLTMAQKYPEMGWIAIEKERNCVAVALKKAEALQLDNILLIGLDAADIDLWFKEGEISNIYLNFSDPWPKNRNSKRRLTYGSFLNKYASVLDDEGKLTFKTDNTHLFEFTLVSMDELWSLQEVSLDFDSEANSDAVTEYERRFKSEGVPIKRAVYMKRLMKK